MRTKAVAMSCSGGLLCLTCDAFIAPPQQRAHVLQPTPHHQLGRSTATPAAGGSTVADEVLRPLLTRTIMSLSGEARNSNRINVNGGVRRTLRAAMSSFDSSGESPRAATPVGPGAGVVELQFENLKAGGFKVFLLLFLLGQGRAPDNDTPFSVRDTPEGIRVLIGDESRNDSKWDGVLDLSWGVEPRPFFRVDRIDVNEVIPYPGELYILNKLLDAVIDVNGEQSVDDHSKLFMFRENEQNQLAEVKAKLAGMAALG
ncbi:unnamed protein product [Pylaiella littoralis]